MTKGCLGEHIREVNVRNRDLTVARLVGLTIDKAFIPSVANVIGTDLSNYKVIRREQFACSLMQVSRDGKIPVAMFEEDEAIMSPAYPMFEVIDTSVLMPQYLMMWFSRSEFDREASYYAVGGVRGSLTWDDFCNMRLPVPSIERQREIVAEYKTLTRRIRLNQQIIQKLEDTAQALYRNTFIDNIDKQNLPPGWHLATIGEFCDIITGKKDVNESLSEGKFRFFSCSPDAYFSNEYIAKGPAVLIAGNGSYTGRVTYYDKEFDLYQRTYACIPKNTNIELTAFLYCILRFEFQGQFMGGSRGSSIPYIVRGDIADFEFVYNENRCLLFSNVAQKILSYAQVKIAENEKLTELQSLLLAKMGQ
ncbi:MAG: restriction endonuclease subunit S [Muribaculaceae bacterium]|nr:restriction endonuclease subunit S [Muribaculaceae bacterium]